MHVCPRKVTNYWSSHSPFPFFQAKVNEDASGDVNALQRQIQQLKVWTSCSLFLPQRSKTVKLKCLSSQTGPAVFLVEAS